MVTVPDAAMELKLHFMTVYRCIKKGKVFSFPFHSVDYLHIREITSLNSEGGSVNTKN